MTSEVLLMAVTGIGPSDLCTCTAARNPPNDLAEPVAILEEISGGAFQGFLEQFKVIFRLGV